MSIESIKSKMEQLRMSHTANLIPELLEEATSTESNLIDFFENVLSLEIQAREERRIATSLKVSGLPKGMHLDNFDFLFQSSVEKPRIDNLATCDFIRNHENVLLFGPPAWARRILLLVLL